MYESGYYWVKRDGNCYVARIGYTEGSIVPRILLNDKEYLLRDIVKEGLEVICKVPTPEEIPTAVKAISKDRYSTDFSRIESTCTSEDKLSRKVYRFSTINNVVVLEEYREETRPTKRHGWVTDKIWKRIGVGGGWRNTAEYPIDTVPWEKAVKLYREELVFGFPEGISLTKE